MLLPLSVSSFLNLINDLVFGEYSIEGEVVHYKISQSKWIFFDLKDDAGILGCFSTVFMVREPLTDGMKIRVRGYPKIYEKTGKFSFTVQSVELVGAGSFQKAFELLKTKLEKEGLFAVERKRALPQLPERLGVIASRDSAAWGDFQKIIANRFGGVELVLCHVAVQGVAAVPAIVRAFEKCNEYGEPLDAIILIRGGGSLEDLAAFNDEAVVRAVYSSRAPVVTGIGHERDVTLVDYVADMRASTPSHAAEIVVPPRSELLLAIERNQELMYARLKQELSVRQQAIEHMYRTMSFSFAAVRTQFVTTIERFTQAIEKLRHQLTLHQIFLDHSQTVLVNLNPHRLLARGFSIVRDRYGSVVNRKEQVQAGQELCIEFTDGSVKVEAI